MITYDPGTWSVAFAFTLQGSVFPKAFAWAAPCALLSSTLHTILAKYEDLGRYAGAGDIAASVLGGFTFILGFLIVFRSQQAYSRWWEGGTLLQQLRGEWFNSYSCLLAFCNSDESKKDLVKKFQHQLVRLYSLLYGCALQQVSTQAEVKFELIAIDGVDPACLDFLTDVPDRCEVVLQWIQRLIVEANAAEILKVPPPILSRVFNELGNGIVNLNNVRKITNFPIPFPLAQMITVMLLFHAMITPVVCAATVQTTFWAGLISFVVTFSYWTINYIAVELEMPFGDDDNDLPLHSMQEDMNASLRTLIRERAQKVPNFHLDLVHDKLLTRIVDFEEDLTKATHVTKPATMPLKMRGRAQGRCSGRSCSTDCGPTHDEDLRISPRGRCVGEVNSNGGAGGGVQTARISSRGIEYSVAASPSGSVGGVSSRNSATGGRMGQAVDATGGPRYSFADPGAHSAPPLSATSVSVGLLSPDDVEANGFRSTAAVPAEMSAATKECAFSSSQPPDLPSMEEDPHVEFAVATPRDDIGPSQHVCISAEHASPAADLALGASPPMAAGDPGTAPWEEAAVTASRTGCDDEALGHRNRMHAL